MLTVLNLFKLFIFLIFKCCNLLLYYARCKFLTISGPTIYTTHTCHSNCNRKQPFRGEKPSSQTQTFFKDFAGIISQLCLHFMYLRTTMLKENLSVAASAMTWFSRFMGCHKFYFSSMIGKYSGIPPNIRKYAWWYK